MKCIMQRKHNECALAVTLMVLRDKGIKINYHTLRKDFNDFFSFYDMHIIFNNYDINVESYYAINKVLPPFTNAVILQKKNILGNHFVVLKMNKNNKISVFNPSLFFRIGFNRFVIKNWTGKIMIIE